MSIVCSQRFIFPANPDLVIS